MDQHAATELKLYIDNDGDLYRQQTTSILKNLATKKVRSQYKHDLAVKAFGYLVEAGAKKYAKEFGTGVPWHKMFDVATRKAVAEDLVKDFEGEFEAGGYDSLLPKKYQAEMVTGGKKFPARGHSTKKRGDRLFIGTFPTGISYADRHEEEHGDYKKIAFLPFSSLALEWRSTNVPAAVRQAIIKHARSVQTRRGQEHQVSTSGQTVRLGHATKKKAPGQLDREIASVLGRHHVGRR